MKPVFKRLSDNRAIDLVPYVKQHLADATENVRIYIGTDSQNVGDVTKYATVVVLHHGNNGAHVIYSKHSVPRVRDTFTRLWNETELSLEVAEILHDAGLPRADYIDLDYNPDPIYRSNSVLRSALGYVESMGYKARCKPYAHAASSVADAICQ